MRTGVKTGISGYAESEYDGQNAEPITMASVPDIIFEKINAEIGEGDRFNERHDRVIKMAILALRETCAKHTAPPPIPLLLAMPEDQDEDEGLSPLNETL